MAYTDNETRKDWKVLDKNALNEWADEFEVDSDEVADFIESNDSDGDNINSHIFGVLYVAGTKYLNALREYCDENEIDYKDTDLEEGREYETLNIYTNYLDSGFNTDLSDLITTNPNEENILEALKVLDIDVEKKKNEESLYEITFYKKDSEEVFDKVNTFANNKEDAVEFLIELDRNSDEPKGLKNLKYSIKDYNDDSLLQDMVKDFEESQIEEATGVERFNGKEVFLLEDWMPDSVFEKFNFYYENEKSSEETIDEALINFDRLTIYENYDKKEMGEEIAFQMSIVNDNDRASKFFNYELIADEYVNDADSGYKENANGEYYYIDDHENLTGVFIGSVKDKHTVNEAFDFVQFKKDGRITNNGLSSSLSTKAENLEFDNVFKYYNTPTYISKEQWNNDIKASLEIEDYKGAFEKIKLIRENVLLFKDEAEYEEYKENFKNNSENKDASINKKTKRDR